MDAIDNVFDPLRDFAKDSVRLVKRCHKPDRKEFTKVAFRTAIGSFSSPSTTLLSDLVKAVGSCWYTHMKREEWFLFRISSHHLSFVPQLHPILKSFLDPLGKFTCNYYNSVLFYWSQDMQLTKFLIQRISKLSVALMNTNTTRSFIELATTTPNISQQE
ncbi:hypothetical protein QYF36_001555 [Acer negundo]|nr:hypothetical protein QYF36_001555 [Acer negundo]